jgi:hypothetical protein
MHIHLSFFFKNKFCSHSTNGAFNQFIENSELKKILQWFLAGNLEEVNPRSMSVVGSKSTNC